MRQTMNHDKHKCGECGYYMPYNEQWDTGDCASIGMNNECNEGINHFKAPDEPLLQVDENEDACGFFKPNRTPRVRKYIKEHKDLYKTRRKKNDLH